MKTLFEYVLRKGIEQPIRLEIKLDEVVYDRTGNEQDARFFNVRINGKDVTQLVADTVGCKVSTVKNAYVLIIYGSGTDMGFYIQNAIYHAACAEGYPNMFDQGNYISVE